MINVGNDWATTLQGLTYAAVTAMITTGVYWAKKKIDHKYRTSADDKDDKDGDASDD